MNVYWPAIKRERREKREKHKLLPNGTVWELFLRHSCIFTSRSARECGILILILLQLSNLQNMQSLCSKHDSLLFFDSAREEVPADRKVLSNIWKFEFYC